MRTQGCYRQTHRRGMEDACNRQVVGGNINHNGGNLELDKVRLRRTQFK